MGKIKVLGKLAGSEMDLCDSDDPNQSVVVALKVIDISNLCSAVKDQAVLKYARVTRGPIVQLNNSGASAHYHYEEMGEDGLTKDHVFMRFAKDYWGISPAVLARIIFQNAPKHLPMRIKIDEKRFVYHGIGNNGKKKHIFPKNILKKALCFRGPALTSKECDFLDVCKECEKEYPIVSKSNLFQLFVG